jgi:allantoinase
LIVDSVLINGRILTNGFLCKAGIAIDDGKIVAIANDINLPKADSTININGKIALPGLIDPHVHINRKWAAESFETGTRAAAVGGITTILDMPTVNSQRDVLPTTTVEGLRWKKELGEKQAIIDFGLYGGEIQKWENTCAIENLVSEGVVGFKITFGGSGESIDDGVVMEAFRKIAKAEVVVSIHAENQMLIQYFRGRLVSEGRKDPIAHSKSRPNLVEAEAISRGILYSQEAGNMLHIAHMSTREGVKLVENAKLRGLKITAETCPHYLFLTKEDYARYGPRIVINPPIRSKEDAAALWRGLSSGIIWETPAGVPGLETSASLMLSEGVNKGRISLERYVQISSENPAKIFGLYPRKGAIQLGSDADITVIDLRKEKTIRASQMKGASDFTPFEGWRVKGGSVMTIVRGIVVAQDGEVYGKPGYGQFIARIHKNNSVWT